MCGVVLLERQLQHGLSRLWQLQLELSKLCSRCISLSDDPVLRNSIELIGPLTKAAVDNIIEQDCSAQTRHVPFLSIFSVNNSSLKYDVEKDFSHYCFGSWLISFNQQTEFARLSVQLGSNPVLSVRRWRVSSNTSAP
mmetsp:Transcript_3897/g.14275  ORF Transcript_3897/g.14275 Transcript_3897/m.14275 type:complete len:138 (-) Transcript_3897:679-1092(-)